MAVRLPGRPIQPVAYNFATAVLPSDVTASGGANGTRVDASGNVVTATAARFDHSPSTRISRGLLIEPARTNVCTQSAAFDDIAWSKSNGTVTANAGTGPDGAATGDKFIPAAASVGGKYIYQQPAVTLGDLIVFSLYAKVDGYRYAQLLGSGGVAGTFYANFDLQTGAETAFDAGTSTVSGRGIEDAGNGWYRIWVAVTALATGSGLMACGVVETGTALRNAVWTSDGTSGVLMWGGQYETGTSPTSYIPTAALSVARTADAISFTVPVGVTTLRFVFDNDTTQDVAVTAGAYNVPTNLNRARIKAISG